MNGWSLWLAESLRLLLGAVFLALGAMKLRSPRRFAAVVRDYQLIPPVLALVSGDPVLVRGGRTI